MSHHGSDTHGHHATGPVGPAPKEHQVVYTTLHFDKPWSYENYLKTGGYSALRRILEEKIAIRPSDIDIVWINGYGWPVYRGGPMFYADTVGLANVVAKLKEYGPKLGADFKISPLLEKLAAEGKKFQDLK